MVDEKLMGGNVLAGPSTKPENQNFGPTDIGLCNFQNQKNQNLSPHVANTSTGLRNQQNQIDSLTDADLYHLCKVYGAKVLKWRQKFIGLLPEVFKRGLYLKKGCGSIYEFAKKLAGLSEEQVRLILNLEKRFENLPELKGLLVNGEVSVNKLARVVSIASPENERFLATNLKVLSKNAVETLVRDEKWKNSEGGGTVNASQNGLFELISEGKSLPGQMGAQLFSTELNVKRHESGSTISRGGLNLSREVHTKLLELQQKGIDMNQLLLEFLQKREAEIAQKKEQIRSQVLEKE